MEKQIKSLSKPFKKMQTILVMCRADSEWCSI